MHCSHFFRFLFIAVVSVSQLLDKNTYIEEAGYFAPQHFFPRLSPTSRLTYAGTQVQRIPEGAADDE
jgi:hypothetical protein